MAAGAPSGTAATVDDLLGGRLRLRQPATGTRAGSDAVFLAAAVPAAAGQRAVELGCGSGAALLCLAWRVSGLALAGVEIVPELAALARDNAAANGLADRVTVLCGAVGGALPELTPASFDHVFANPPFFEAGRSTPPAGAARTLARVAPPAALAAWIDQAHVLLKPRGTLTVIQRTERLAALLAACAGRFGGIAVLPLWPGGGRPAKRLVLQARKGSKAPLTLLPGLVLHDAPATGGGYTAAAEAVLRQGAALLLSD